MTAKPRKRRQFEFLAGFIAFFVALWLLWETPFVYPVKLLVVLLHELSHAVAALATGGRVAEIQVTPDQGGLCVCPGGDAFATLSAGYLGSLAWGGLMVWWARRFPPHAAWLTAVVGAALLIATPFMIRSPVALLLSLAFGAGLVAAARYLPASGNRWILTALGLTSCLYALLDIKSDILDRPGELSDARMLAELTGVPTVVWGVMWIGAGLGVCYLLFLWSWRRA